MNWFFYLPFVFLAFIGISLAGLILLSLAVRGKPVFSMPRCAKCSYDLRGLPFLTPEQLGACPECGATLGEIGAVSFGKWKRQPRKIWLGVALLALPWVLAVPVTLFARHQAMARFGGPGAKSSQTTATILATLPQTVDTPWDWQELQRRLQLGTLSNQDATAAIKILTTHLQQRRAAGQSRQPLHWAGSFIKAVTQRGAVGDEEIKALRLAYYDSKPEIISRDRVREGEALLAESRLDASWNLEGERMVWCLTSVTADGTTKVAPELRYGETGKRNLADQLSATDGYMNLKIPQSLPPGEHELTFTYEMGVVSDQSVLRAIDGKPGTPEKWPNPLARWQTSAKRKITVVPKEGRVIKWITDPAADPFKSSFTLTVAEALVRPASRGVELAVKWKLDGKPATPIAYRVTAQAGEQKVDLGRLVYAVTPRGTMTSINDRATVKSLPADVRKIDVTLTPEPKFAEEFVDLDQIWGQPRELKDVPLQRFDVSEASAERPPTQPSGP